VWIRRHRYGANVARNLFGVGQVVDLGFQGLVVLAFDLEFGLEFLDQKFEARYFGAEFLRVVAGHGAKLRRRGWMRGRAVLAGVIGLSGRKMLCCRRSRVRREGFG